MFCRLSGIETTVSEINQDLQDAWCDFGVEVPHITCTIIRKTYIWYAREKDIDREDEIGMAKHMNHSVETADQHDKTTGEKFSAKFSEIPQTFIDFGGTHDDNEPDSDEEEEVDKNIPSQIEEDLSVEFDLCASHQLDNQTSKTDNSKKFFGKSQVFTPKDRERIRRCCMPHVDKCLSTGDPIRMPDVLEQIDSAGIAFSDILIKYTKHQMNE